MTVHTSKVAPAMYPAVQERGHTVSTSGQQKSDEQIPHRLTQRHGQPSFLLLESTTIRRLLTWPFACRDLHIMQQIVHWTKTTTPFDRTCALCGVCSGLSSPSSRPPLPSPHTRAHPSIHVRLNPQSALQAHSTCNTLSSSLPCPS